VKHFDTPGDLAAADVFPPMNYIALIALVAASVLLGACAKDEPAYTSTTQSTATTSYRK
jgi:hypothetical protein